VRSAYIVVFVFLAVSFIAAMFLERADLISIGKPLSWVGSFWLAAFVYFLLILASVDLIRLVNHFIHFSRPSSLPIRRAPRGSRQYL